LSSTSAWFGQRENWAEFGTVSGMDMVKRNKGHTTSREVHVEFPVLAHEVGHYIALPDIDTLKKKFKKVPDENPWWIDELIKLRKLKGLEKDWSVMMKASYNMQRIYHKKVFEGLRTSSVVGGYHFLQFSDTVRYENKNGLVDPFDDFKKGVDPKEYLKYTGDVVVVADLPERTWFEGSKFRIPVYLSNWSETFREKVKLSWSLKSVENKSVRYGSSLADVEAKPGLQKVCTLDIELPRSARALTLKLEIKITGKKGPVTRNDWEIWQFPNRPADLPLKKATVSLSGIDLYRRYPRVKTHGNLNRPQKLMIVNRFSEAVFNHLKRGGDVLMLWRVEETRDRKAKKEKYYMPSTWDRFKASIWDRGHNLGGFTRQHPALRNFPETGSLDFQMYGIINDADKLSLDGFPVKVAPVIQGNDKATRDRYDPLKFKLSEFQPGWTLRKFAYLFDLRAGRGRLMMSGFNFTGLNNDVPEVCGMFESIISCITSKKWKPQAKISVEDLRRYLLKKGRAPRIKERMMTQYWQIDRDSLETAEYWKEAEAWIRQG
jgi:hypothetical protein